jgi:hypothetical protein
MLNGKPAAGIRASLLYERGIVGEREVGGGGVLILYGGCLEGVRAIG